MPVHPRYKLFQDQRHKRGDQVTSIIVGGEMTRTSSKFTIIVLVVLLLSMPSIAACSSSDSDEEVTPVNSPTPSDVPIVEITIGNFTDITGVSANAMEILTMAMEDTVAYYNDNALIPGVEFDIITYDGQYDPARDIPGYQWMKERGVDLLWCPVAGTGLTLKPLLEEDKMVMILMSPNDDVFVPPGWVFALGNALYEELFFTLLDWIVENDADYPADRPAKLGAAMWNEGVGIAIVAAAEKYAKANPDQYEWEGGFLTDFSFIWNNEAEALKDCDYVIPPVPPMQFVEAYRQLGGKAKFIGADAHVAFMGMVDSADLWDEMDGMLVIRPFKWWTDQDEMTDFTREILYANRADDAEDIIRTGVGYITVQPVYMMLELIKETVETVGAENFNSEALYNVAQMFEITIDGCHHSFSETKRTSNDSLNIHELRASEKDLFRVHEGWLPIVTPP